MTDESTRPIALQPWASDPLRTRGRRHVEPVARTRNDFQRDRDRIVHSAAFRRLVYKTQVFLNHEGDLFRTRLTHSLEVAQIARTIARTMGLNEDLCEAIALAHDLGHAPFGHAGQDALNECLQTIDPQGLGFEHNFQSLRVVDVLEERYPSFDGLNLTFETREGILKHCSKRRALGLETEHPGDVGRRFLEGTQPSLEAQVCNLADEIAYNAHDIDDGLRSGLLRHEQLREVPLFERLRAAALRDVPALAGRRLLYETLRRLLSMLIDDVVATSNELLFARRPESADHARTGPPLIRFSAETAPELRELGVFLRSALYRHERVVRTTEAARAVLHDLFGTYMVQPDQLLAENARREPRHQVVADYIAGMTDRFALREHRRLTGAVVDLGGEALIVG
jgi:dGTPase